MKKLKYVPVFRGKSIELNVLKDFDFGENIYPCLEIIKRYGKPKSEEEKRQYSFFPHTQGNSFQNFYIKLIKHINAKHIFIDLPVHLKPENNMKPPTLSFLQEVVINKTERTAHLKRLSVLNDKIIPVISSYLKVTGKSEIISQSEELREIFPTHCFRIFLDTYIQDFNQIKNVIKPNDYLIVDLDNAELDFQDPDILDIKDELESLDCNVILHRNPIPYDFKMCDIEHGDMIDYIDNSLIYDYKKFGAQSFSDYVAIKKDYLFSDGGVPSPGFVFYDATINNFFGFRYKNGGHKRNETKPNPEEFETTIVPAVISSKSAKNMMDDGLGYLKNNWGWETLNKIYNGEEPGKNAVKFKRITMEHYLHCIQLKINDNQLN